MNLTLSVPLAVLRTWALVLATLGVVVWVLLPSSILAYLHFQHSVLPQGPITIPLEFTFPQHAGVGPYAYVDLSTYDKQLGDMWKSLSKNRFTKLSHSVMFNMEYVNLGAAPCVGNVRTTFTKGSPKLTTNARPGWAFLDVYPVLGQREGVLAFGEIVDKSITKSLLLNIPPAAGSSNVEGVLDYMMPRWVQNVFVPTGWIALSSFSTLDWLLGRSESQLFGPKAGGLRLNLPHKPMVTTVELSRVSTESLVGNLADKKVLVELDRYDAFVVRGSITLEWVFDGLRFWIYWWPGLCFVVGVGLLWMVASSCCITVSVFGYGWVELRGLFGQDSANTKLKKNLNELQKLGPAAEERIY